MPRALSPNRVRIEEGRVEKRRKLAGNAKQALVHAITKPIEAVNSIAAECMLPTVLAAAAVIHTKNPAIALIVKIFQHSGSLPAAEKRLASSPNAPMPRRAKK